MRVVFGVRGYRRLLSVYALNEVGWSIGLLALALLVYRRTGSAWASTGFFLASQFLPAFVSPPLVARVHRVTPSRMLAVLYAGQAVGFLVLAGAPSHFAFVPVLVLISAAGIVGLAARPIARATTSSLLVPAGLLREGNAVTNGAFAVCIMVGPIIGGGLVSLGGTTAALLVVVGIFAAIAVVLVAAHDLPGRPQDGPVERRRMRAAIAVAGRDRGTRRLLSFQAVALVFFSVSVPVEVVFAQHSLHAGAGGYGGLLSAWGTGAIAGSAAYARWRRLPGWLLIALSSVAIGAGFLVMAVAPTLAVALVGSAIGGIGNGIEAVAERTALQERVDERWMALTLSLNESIFQALPGAGFLLGGGIAAVAGARVAFAVGGFGAVAVGLLAPAVLRVTELRPGTGAAAAGRSSP